MSQLRKVTFATYLNPIIQVALVDIFHVLFPSTKGRIPIGAELEEVCVTTLNGTDCVTAG